MALQRTIPVAVALVLAVAASPRAGADPARGELLYENHCHVCHESSVHVRERRKARTRADITAWVTRWQAHLGLGWTRADIEDVADFLAVRYYGLEAAP